MHKQQQQQLKTIKAAKITQTEGIISCAPHFLLCYSLYTFHISLFPPIPSLTIDMELIYSFLLYFIRCSFDPPYSNNNNWKVWRKIKSPKKTFTHNRSSNTKKLYNVTRKILKNLSKHPGVPSKCYVIFVQFCLIRCSKIFLLFFFQ